MQFATTAAAVRPWVGNLLGMYISAQGAELPAKAMGDKKKALGAIYQTKGLASN